MTQLEQTKSEVTRMLKSLCARCKEEIKHVCPVQQVTREIKAITGVPVIVNDQLYHVVFN